MKSFDLRNKEQIKKCRTILETFYKEHKRKYINTFFYEKDLLFDEFDLAPLVKTRILSKIGQKFRANVQVFPLSGKFICTDFNYSLHRKKGNSYITEKDGVWGILPEETPVIAKKSDVQKEDVVLDLATGCGMIAIFCAEKAKKVIGTDINPKAVNYAKFNAILNDLENKVEFYTGDLFESVKGKKFDLIIWNGPTVALPNVPEKYPIYSYGGMDGTDFTRRFINEVFDYLKPGGRLQWYDCAAGDDKYPASLSYLLAKWGNRNIKVLYNSLTSSPVSLKKSFEMYAKYNLEGDFKTPLAFKPVTMLEEKKWHEWLRNHNYTNFYYALIEVIPNDKFEVILNFPKKDIRTDRYLTRDWHWMNYRTILNKLEIAEKY